MDPMKKDTQKYLYFDIPKQERDSAIAYLLDALLKSKIECEPSKVKASDSDEDVNIYLAHLLFAASLPDYQTAIKRYLSSSVSEMAELLEENDDRIVRYFIYKVNADHLLVHLGIFHDLENAQNKFQKSEQQYASMAQNYYQQAAEYNQRIYRRETAIGSVLEKLSHRFSWYQEVLHIARKEFFHFSNRFRDQEFLDFCDKLSYYESKSKSSELMDQFLDVYGKWKKERSQENLADLKRVVNNMKIVDPGFSFNFNQGEIDEAA
jgi:hypothetical protein